VEDFMARVFAWMLAAMATVVAFLPAGAWAQDRFALVIGNSKYQAVTPLPNPIRDAEAVSAFLKSAGFDVTTAADLGQVEMRRAVRDFAEKLSDKGENTVALIYFAGHGVQVDGENYLLPVDAKIGREADIPLEAVRFADVMNSLDRVRSKVRIVFLDACRNNPFDDGKAPRGLAIVNAPEGSLVAYSTSPGATAEDGSGANSPFTAALMLSGRTPGAPIETTLKDVRLSVHKVTAGRQVPWEVSSLIAPFSFFPEGQAVAAAPRREQSAEAWRKELQSRSPEEAVDIVIRADDVIVYREFLALFPQSPFAARLRGLMERRVMMWDWFDAVSLDLPSGYEAFLKLYPDSDLAATAQRMMQRARLRTAVASTSPGALGILPTAARGISSPGAPQVRTVIKEVPVVKTVIKEVPSPPEIKTVIKEVPVVKTVVKEVPVVREVKVPVIKEIKVPVVKTVTKVVNVPTPCRCTAPPPRGPTIGIVPHIRIPLRGPPNRGHGHPR
jgi:hypothetical protein